MHSENIYQVKLASVGNWPEIGSEDVGGVQDDSAFMGDEAELK